MALKQAEKDALKAMGFDVDKLITAVKDENEVEFEMPKIVAFKQEDLDSRDRNKIEEGKKLGEKTGEEKGKELAAKALKKKFALEDNEKDLDKVIDLVTAKAQTGDEGLREQNKLLIADKARLSDELKSERTRSEAALFDASLIAMFPANRSNEMTDSERLALTKMHLSFEDVDGKKVAKRNGEILRDPTTQNPLELSKVIGDYFSERKWSVASGGQGGRGGGDNPPGPGGIKTFSQAEKAFIAQNPNGNIHSAEFDAYLSTVTKDVPDFDYDS